MTNLGRLSTLVLEVQPYLIILIWPHLGVFLVLFRPFGAFFGLDLGLKTFLKPVYVDYQFWLWNYSPIWFFSFGPFWGLFGSFWARGAIFGVGFRSKSFFGTYLHSLTTFVLEVCGFYGSLYFSGWLGGWVAGWIS